VVLLLALVVFAKFDMAWWWYFLAAALYLFELFFLERQINKHLRALWARIGSVERRLP
jgi:hypothetical protein